MEKTKIDVKSGSMAFNRLDMQVSQALLMAIELFDNLDYLFVMDYYDDLTIFDNSENPKIVSYYQMKTNEDSISLNTIISNDWLNKLYAHINSPNYLIENLGLITNCPIKIEKKTISVPKTKFSDFNEDTIQKIKNDIAKKNSITTEEVDLSKFIHIRTTLTIAKHRDIAEKELENVLEKKYPRITVNAVKIIFQSIIDILTRRQEYEELPDSPSFAEIRATKGVSKEDVDRIIKMTLFLSMPEFEKIEQIANFEENIRNKASYEYTKILGDVQKRDAGFYSLAEKIKNELEKQPKVEAESYAEYSQRIANSITKSPVYNDLYKQVLTIAIIYNNLLEEQ